MRCARRSAHRQLTQERSFTPRLRRVPGFGQGIAAQIAHGIMQWADGGLFLAFGIKVEHSNGPGGSGVGRNGSEENEEECFHGRW